jgi:hypothetical protein
LKKDIKLGSGIKGLGEGNERSKGKMCCAGREMKKQSTVKRNKASLVVEN